MRRVRVADIQMVPGLGSATAAILALALVLGNFAAPPPGEAQQVGRLPALVVLITDLEGNLSLPILTQGLRDLGYVDGKNIAIVVRSAGGKPDALPGLAAELVQQKVTVLFAAGPAAIRSARDATTVAPIVALDLESDPVQAGWARSLARPGGNLTGLFLVGVLWDSTTGSAQLAAANAAAQGLAIDVNVMEVRSTDDLDVALRAGVSAGARGFLLLSSPVVSTGSSQIADFTAKNKLPAISPFRRFADAGGLMAYGPDFNDFRQRAASYVDRILRGARPGDLPIQQLTKFEFVVNLKTAKALGLTIPQSVLLRADEVIR